MMKLTELQIEELAKKYGLTYAIVRTVIEIESSGSGFIDGKLKIQFEPRWFEKLMSKATLKRINLAIERCKNKAWSEEDKAIYNNWKLSTENKVSIQATEQDAFKAAFSLDQKACYLSTSYGLGQIMGFNFKRAGYISVTDMVHAFNESEYNQLKGMLEFINTDPGMFQALKNKNWREFAKRYNGPAYEKFSYHKKLEESYNQFA